MSRGRKPDPNKPGLRAILAATTPGVCPFCASTLRMRSPMPQVVCATNECRKAYFSAWGVDARARAREARAAAAGAMAYAANANREEVWVNIAWDAPPRKARG